MKRLPTSLAAFLLKTPGPRRNVGGAATRTDADARAGGGRARQVAMAAVFLSAVTAGASGCLAPQWIEGELPPTNLPPRIALVGIEPRQSGGSLCFTEQDLSIEFRLDSLSDPDGVTDQVLEARWFLDYSPDSASPKQIGQSQRLVPVEEGSTRYQPPVLNSDRIPRADLQPLGSVHRLSVVVSDGFDPDYEAAPVGRALLDNAYEVFAEWVIEYRGDAVCP